MNKVIASLILIATPGLAEAYDFKGIEIGKPATPELIQEKLGVKCGIGASQMQVCNGYPTLAGHFSEMNLVIAADGNVQRIRLSFDSDNFESVETAILEKFGKPALTEKPQVSNRMGASFGQIEHTWKDADGNFAILKKYAGTLDKSSLYFASPAEFKMLEEHAKVRAKDL